MNNKQLRKLRTKEIIQDNVVSSQDNLLKLLLEEGFHLTQATLSRDLKEMNVSKVSDSTNGFRYILPEEAVAPNPKSDVRGFLSLTYSSNMAIIKTLAGYASPLAVLMDNNPSDFVIGTIAGRDTIFVVLNENNNDRDEFKAYLDEILYRN